MSWEPVTAADLEVLAALAATASTVEGNAGSALAGVDTPGELVAWAWVVDEDRTHVLLVDHNRFGIWMPPGGRARPGEHPADASARELTEETGLVGRLAHAHPALIDAVHSTDPAGRPAPTFGIAYLYVADRTAVLTPEPGQPVAWWPIADPPERRAAHHWRRLTHHLRGLDALRGA